ncbi:MAG: hypothetical protein JNL11_18650 [Bdellovibrionaceae bacterium]|nr:hypothetical protein [Pseudobdellovibrionaceae bacterium]
MNKKRKQEIADLVKSGKSSKDAYEATKKNKPVAKTTKKKTAKKATKK